MRVAIVDDEDLEAAAVAADVRAAGFEPIIVAREAGSAQDTARRIASTADVALVDHRLQYGDWADFDGATLADALWTAGVPTVLVTMFKSQDAAGSIREHRAHIPVVLGRDDVDPETIAAALQAAQTETSGDTPRSRRPHRTMLHVEDVDRESGMVDAAIPQWRSRHAVRFPLNLVPGSTRETLSRGDVLVANVNIDAEADDDLFITDISAGPDPDDN